MVMAGLLNFLAQLGGNFGRVGRAGAEDYLGVGGR